MGHSRQHRAIGADDAARAAVAPGGGVESGVLLDPSAPGQVPAALRLRLPAEAPWIVVVDHDSPPGAQQRHRRRQAARVLLVVVHEEGRVPGVDGVEAPRPEGRRAQVPLDQRGARVPRPRQVVRVAVDAHQQADLGRERPGVPPVAAGEVEDPVPGESSSRRRSSPASNPDIRAVRRSATDS